MIGGHTVAVVIPAFNEELLLPRTLATLPDYVDRVVVVDDASLDDTKGAAERAVSKASITVVRHAQNQGVGAAIVTGYRWCVDQSMDIAVVMGADNQMHPSDMSALLWPLVHHKADYVVGDRLSWPGGWRIFPPVRLFGIVVLAAMTRWATGVRGVRDAQCGYTAITRAALQALPLDALYPRYGFPNDMLSKVGLAGQRVTTRPVRPVYGEETSDLRIPKIIVPYLKLTLRNRAARLARSPASSRGADKGVARYPSSVSVSAEPRGSNEPRQVA